MTVDEALYETKRISTHRSIAIKPERICLTLAAEVTRQRAEIERDKKYTALGKTLFDAIELAKETGDFLEDATRDEQINSFLDVWKRQRAEIERLREMIELAATEYELHVQESNGKWQWWNLAMRGDDNWCGSFGSKWEAIEAAFKQWKEGR